MNATVARVTSPRNPRTAQRIPYAEASRVLLRDSILDGMRELLLTRDWSSITLSDVAKAAGISRQTIYNEFGSRQGLAQGYALRLADRLVERIEDAIGGNVGDIYAAFLQGFRDFFDLADYLHYCFAQPGLETSPSRPVPKYRPRPGRSGRTQTCPRVGVAGRGPTSPGLNGRRA